jgi:drug/metabolite transporter (DMT)-like permease
VKISKLKSIHPSHLFVLILLAVTWGSSFILMKRGMFDAEGLPVFSPGQVAALRLSIAGLLLSPLAFASLRHIRKADWKWLAVVGLIGSGIPAFLFTNAQRYLDSGLAGILNSLTPVFALILGILLFGKKANQRQVWGVLLGLAGAVGLIALKGIGNTENWAYSFLIVLATLSYGLSVNAVAQKLSHLKSLQITSLSLLFAGIPAGIYALSSNVVRVVETNPNGWTSLGYVVLLAAGGTCMANMLYFWLTQQTTALFATSVTYIMPIVAVAWGILDGEHLHFGHILCGIVILSGIRLLTLKPAS